MSTVIVVLAHHDYTDSIQTDVHGVYVNEQMFIDEANQLGYEYDILNDVYFTVNKDTDTDVEFEITLQHVKGST